MLQVFSQAHKRLCLLQGYKELKLTKKLADGDREISFKYPRGGIMARFLINENYIRTKEDEFVLKEVGTGKEWRSYVAVLNLEDLQGKSFESFEAVEKTVGDCLTQALQGTGWSVGQCDVRKRRTIRKDSVCTALEVISQCISTYKCEIEYHSLTKVIDVYEHIGRDRGVYFMESLNLRRVPSMKSTSNGLYTQIRPIGKDGLKINVDGKDYLENHSYSPKNIMLTWKDERYTVAASLMEDAELKLAEICKPVITYEADVIDLAAASETYMDILQYDIGDTVTLISKTEGVKEKMRIAVIDRYPDKPENNSCQLSTAKKTFADIQQEVKEAAVAEATAISAARTSQSIEDEAGNTSGEIKKEMEALKTELLEYADSRFLEKGAAAGLAADAALAAAEKAAGDMDDKLEAYVTVAKAQRDISNASDEIIREIDGRNYVNRMEMGDEMKNLADQVYVVETDIRNIVDRLSALEKGSQTETG